MAPLNALEHNAAPRVTWGHSSGDTRPGTHPWSPRSPHTIRSTDLGHLHHPLLPTAAHMPSRATRMLAAEAEGEGGARGKGAKRDGVAAGTRHHATDRGQRGVGFGLPRVAAPGQGPRTVRAHDERIAGLDVADRRGEGPDAPMGHDVAVELQGRYQTCQLAGRLEVAAKQVVE